MVVVDRDGGLKAAYLGEDAAAADKAFDTASADRKNEAVRLILYPAPARTRYPSEEVAQAAVSAKARRIGLETEVEAAASALKMARDKFAAAEEDCKKQRAAIEAVEGRKDKGAPLHSAESLRALQAQGENLIKRLAAKSQAVSAAQERLKKAEQALKAFDGATDSDKTK